MKTLRQIDSFLARIEHIFLIMLLSVMILLAFLQVVLRNFFSTSILWGDTFLRQLVLWVGFLGATLAAREKRHINIDIFSRLLSARAQNIVETITNLFAAVVCVFLTKAAIVFICDEKSSGSTLLVNIPTWIFILIIAIGFGLMTFRFVTIAIENTFHLLKKESQ